MNLNNFKFFEKIKCKKCNESIKLETNQFCSCYKYEVSTGICFNNLFKSIQFTMFNYFNYESDLIFVLFKNEINILKIIYNKYKRSDIILAKLDLQKFISKIDDDSLFKFVNNINNLL